MNHRISFSRVFPKTHPRAGELTNFQEKILACLGLENGFDKKSHTIRPIRKKPIEVGDTLTMFSWTGKPYNSKQRVFAENVKVTHVYRVKVLLSQLPGKIYGICIYDGLGGIRGAVDANLIRMVAKNDGLSSEDFEAWFGNGKSTEFDGELICWNPDINYFNQ